jgi:predicted hotdog family 3-hydroxylacyl-ACP dehydratase
VLRLDDIETDLIAQADLIAGDRGSALYDFAVTSGAQRLLSGRATVVFDANARLIP